MSIFFNEAIFLKEDSDLEKELEEVISLQDRVKSKDEYDKLVKMLKAGINGEKTIEYELKNSRIGMYVLHDINLQCDEQNAQIDYLIITPAHTYVVECKNMIGDITVDNNGQFIRKLPNGKKESIYSPITQAIRHVDLIKKIREKDRNTFESLVGSLIKDDYFKPLVVVANSSCVLNDRFAKKELKNMIVRSDALIDYLKKDMENASIVMKDSKKAMETQAQTFLKLNVPKKENNWLNRIELKEENKDLVCPKCGGKLILRTAKQGNFAGNKFYGCSNYPKCKYIQNI